MNDLMPLVWQQEEHPVCRKLASVISESYFGGNNGKTPEKGRLIKWKLNVF